MRALALLLFAMLAAGCGGAGPSEPEAAPSALALPVVAPMHARERLLHDLDKQKQLARDRAAAFDEAAGRDH